MTTAFPSDTDRSIRATLLAPGDRLLNVHCDARLIESVTRDGAVVRVTYVGSAAATAIPAGQTVVIRPCWLDIATDGDGVGE